MVKRYVMNAGDFRTLITLQRATIATDASGAQKPTYANVASNPTVWARWENAHGAESVNTGGAKENAQRATVTIRYRSDIDATCAVVLNTSTWKVLSVDNIQQRGEYLEMQVELSQGTV